MREDCKGILRRKNKGNITKVEGAIGTRKEKGQSGDIKEEEVKRS